jgi:hypothetical protein
MAEDLSSYSNAITLCSDGIWRPKSISPVSYPDEGNDICFSVEENSFWFNHRNTVLVNLLKSNNEKGPIFDVGGGNGFVSAAFVKNGIDAIVIEPGSGANNAFKKGLPVINGAFQDCELRELPAVGIFDVLEHIKDDLLFLKKVHAAMKSGAHLYITVPASMKLWSDADIIAGHFKRYTLESIKSILNKADFNLIFGTYFFWPLAFPLFCFKALPFRLFKRKVSWERAKAEVYREHRLPSTASGILDFFLSKERSRILNGKKIPFGSSCLVVAYRK